MVLKSRLAYYDKLKPSCVDAGVSYEERVERREAEIQSAEKGTGPVVASGDEIGLCGCDSVPTRTTTCVRVP